MPPVWLPAIAVIQFVWAMASAIVEDDEHPLFEYLESRSEGEEFTEMY